MCNFFWCSLIKYQQFFFAFFFLLDNYLKKIDNDNFELIIDTILSKNFIRLFPFFFFFVFNSNNQKKKLLLKNKRNEITEVQQQATVLKQQHIISEQLKADKNKKE